MRKAFAIFFSLFVCTATVFATQLPVSSNADSGPGSLREQVGLASQGDTIIFTLNDSILLSSQIEIDTHLYIMGPANALQIISGGGQSRIFKIGVGDSVSLQNLELRNGNALGYTIPGGGAIATEGFLVMSQCYLHHHRAGFGGAISNGRPGIRTRMDLLDCTFAYNEALNPSGNANGAPEGGGAIYADGNMMGAADLNAFNCTFAHNRAGLDGGAIYLLGVFAVANQTSFDATNCTFAYNQATNSGTFGYFDSPVYRVQNSIMAENEGFSPILDGSLLSRGNNLFDASVGIFFSTMGQPEPSDLLDIEAEIGVLGFNGGLVPTVPISCLSPAIDHANPTPSPANDARGIARTSPDLGAFEWQESDLTVDQLSANGPGSLAQGVLLACENDTLDIPTLQGTLFLDQTLELDKSISIFGNPTQQLKLHGGDSIRLVEILSGNTVHLRNLTLERAGPDNYGGGAILNKGTLLLENSTLAFNRALSGGAIGNYGEADTARLTAINCTFGHNEATELDGGAIDNRMIQQAAIARLVHCTFSDNVARDKGGAVNNSAASSLFIQNSLLAGNRASEGPDAYGALTSEGPNLISRSQDMTLTTTFTELLDQAANLDPLFSYGGPNPTYRLQAGSPAIDAALNLPELLTDQRGEARIFNGTADIGAYEYDPATSLQSFSPIFVQVYPNPSQGVMTLQTSAGSWELAILDLQGQQIVQQTLEVPATGKVKLNFDLPTGLYLLQLRSEQRSGHVKLMIQ